MGLSFKPSALTRQEAEKLISKYENMVIISTYNILFTNDIAVSSVVEAVAELRNIPTLYRHKVKMYCNKLEKAYQVYERVLNYILKDSCDFFADANDLFTSEVEPHCEALRKVFKQELESAGLNHLDILSKIELALTLCEFACFQYDKRMASLQKKDLRFKLCNVSYMCPTDMKRFTKLLEEEVASLCGKDKIVNLSTQSCQDALDVVMEKLGNIDLIAKAINVYSQPSEDKESEESKIQSDIESK